MIAVNSPFHAAEHGSPRENVNWSKNQRASCRSETRQGFRRSQTAHRHCSPQRKTSGRKLPRHLFLAHSSGFLNTVLSSWLAIWRQDGPGKRPSPTEEVPKRQTAFA